MDMLLSTGEQVTIALSEYGPAGSIGQPAISLTGAQVGIVTEPDPYPRPHFTHCPRTTRATPCRKGKVVVVAGFQGITNTQDLI